jgi:hypothetical protein
MASEAADEEMPGNHTHVALDLNIPCDPMATFEPEVC